MYIVSNFPSLVNTISTKKCQNYRKEKPQYITT